MPRSNESLIWKLEVEGVKLFTKLSATEAHSNICVDPITQTLKKCKLPSRRTSVLSPHISTHSDYKKEWDKLQAEEEKKANAQKGALDSFVTKGRLNFAGG